MLRSCEPLCTVDDRLSELRAEVAQVKQDIKKLNAELEHLDADIEQCKDDRRRDRLEDKASDKRKEKNLLLESLARSQKKLDDLEARSAPAPQGE